MEYLSRADKFGVKASLQKGLEGDRDAAQELADPEQK